MRLSIALVLAVVAACSARDFGIAPIGKELIYKFKNYVSVGTKEPNEFYSQHSFNGNLHIVGVKENIVYMAISDVVYKIENGEHKVPVSEPIAAAPAEAGALTIPFMVEYDPTGKISGIRVAATDVEWSINMKKAIASNFQIVKVDSIFKELTTTFASVLEDTIYGMCNVNYQIAKDQERVLVKTVDPSGCKNYMHLKESKDFVSTDSEKIYYFMKLEGTNMIKSIRSQGGIIAHPKGMKYENGYLSVVQLIDFVKQVDASVKVPENNGVLISSLKFYDPIDKCRDVPLQSVVDITGGRHVVDAKLLIQKIDNLLEQVVHYFDEHHVTLMKPEMKNINLINQILFELETADLGILEQTFALLTEKSKSDIEMRKLTVYIELLPFIGSRPSAILIRNLIRKNKIENESVVQRILSNLPEQVHCPTEKLLLELEDLLNLKNVNSSLYEVSLLSYASLVRRTFENIDEKSKVLEKYISIFAERFEKETEFSMKVLYLECMGNIKVGSVTKRLLTLLEENTNKEMRIPILNLLKPRLQSDINLLVRTVWPILTDRTADMHVRLMAYMIYVNPDKPTVSHFMNLYWLLRYDPSERLYSFHYNTIKSFSKNPRFFENSQTLGNICKLILRISRKPLAKTNEGIFIAEKVDSDNGLGMRGDVLAVIAETGGHMTIQLHRKFNNEIVEMFSVFIYQEDYKSFYVVSHKNGFAVNMLQIMSSDPDKLFYQAMSIIAGVTTGSDNDTLETVLMPMSFEKVVSNDIGAPVKLYDRKSVVLQLQFKYEKLENFELDFHIRHVMQQSLGMKFYNPINNMWHGIQELKTLASNIPINAELDMERSMFKITLKSKSENNYILGAQYYGESQVFVENVMDKKDREILGIAGNSESYVKIGSKHMKPKNVTVREERISEIGRNFKMHAFECDQDVSQGYLQRFLDYRNLGSCGYGFQLLPMKDVDRLECIIDYNTDGANDVTPTKETYSLELKTISTANNTLTDKMIKISRPFSSRKSGPSTEFFGEFSDESNFTLPFYVNVTLSQADFEFKIVVNETEDGDQTRLQFTFKGMRSEEQSNTKNILSKQCKREFYLLNETMPLSRECYLAETSLRKYVMDFDATYKTGEKVDYNVEVVFPLLRPDEWDIKSDIAGFREGVPNVFAENHLHFLSPPVNQFFGILSVDQDTSRKTCIIGSTYLMKTDLYRSYHPISQDYSLYYKNVNNENRIYEVYAKAAASGKNHEMAFRMIYNTEIIECEPTLKGLECKLDGKVLSDPTYTNIKTHMKRYFTTNPNMLLLEADGVLAVYDGYNIRLELTYSLSKDRSWDQSVVTGLCIK